MHDLAPIAALPVLAASFLGSPHCAGMCGGFVALYAHAARTNHLAHILYNLGRLGTYLALGVGAALLGATFDAASGIARVSALVVGGGIILYGFALLVGLQPTIELPVFKSIARLLAPLTTRFLRSKSPLKPFLVGSITTLLPCGWLYTFVALALASADPVEALGIMALFWAGSVPMMLGVGYAARATTTLGARRFPRLVGVLLIFGGFLALRSHLNHTHHHSHTRHTGHDLHHAAGAEDHSAAR